MSSKRYSTTSVQLLNYNRDLFYSVSQNMLLPRSVITIIAQDRIKARALKEELCYIQPSGLCAGKQVPYNARFTTALLFITTEP